MTKNIFNPTDWLETPKIEVPIKPIHKTAATVHTVVANDIESYIAAIEQNAIDITSGYANWRDLGFAFAEEYGETGRNYFHSISKFNSSYNAQECDEQYDKCLAAKGSGITIATFYYLAKQAGITVVKNEPQTQIVPNVIEEKAVKKLPTFPKSIVDTLPHFLQQVVKPTTSPEESDIMLLGALTTLSACFPKLFGIYDGKKVFANLFLFVTAPASAGKGRLTQCKNLVTPIHKDMREQASVLKKQFDAENAVYNMNKGKNENLEKPSKPPERMLFIPANNSTTGVFQLLSDNEGKGLIFETEGDTLAQAFKSDYGNYSDGFRKAFHHETISYYRRTDREYVDIENPCLSTVLSGTPKQVSSLIPNAENGLFSRFIFYYMNITPIWKNVFEIQTENGLDEYYNALGTTFLGFYKTLKNNPPIQVTFSLQQQIKFNQYFSKIQTKYLNIQTEDYIATIRRMGIIAYRIAMLFTALRIMEDGDVNTKRECEEVDFNNAMAIIAILIQHSSQVFNALPADTKLPTRSNRKERFLENLPSQFSRQDYLDTATALSIPHKTAEGYITKFVKAGLIHRDTQGKYLNNTNQETKEVEELKKNA
ncbi:MULTISPECIES: DUF3987 domain-containing protein [Flavobacteriaceae]|uniref:DUF3987 domain-containing protein n=2 Tax=Flavobacteriaceae TaxID=49546 RepID=A0A4Y8AWW4_9FLAO|nr:MULTISPECIES: DUF3987 domain-containing protein [Flavobacteriaceae]TEW76522.1 DUF3987 domain-containing protein [Gramella jeungdoensis]GGK53664.1 hypothetical protein GCM10007963_22480 [Lutibacter litoralis]